MSVTKIFVGYTTRTVPDEMLEPLMPEFEARKGTVDEAKKAEQIAEKKAKWAADAANMPYTGTFAKVQLAVPSREVSVVFSSGEREPFGDQPAVSRQVRAWLLKNFPGAWSNDPNFRGQHEVIFVGFNPRGFLKLLGIECSLPRIGEPLPLSMWYGNSDHRDISQAVIPTEFKTLIDWKTVLNARRVGLAEEDQQVYDKLLSEWAGPGHDATVDVAVAVLLGEQLGFIND